MKGSLDPTRTEIKSRRKTGKCRVLSPGGSLCPVSLVAGRAYPCQCLGDSFGPLALTALKSSHENLQQGKFCSMWLFTWPQSSEDLEKVAAVKPLLESRVENCYLVVVSILFFPELLSSKDFKPHLHNAPSPSLCSPRD